jgi:hypothetical protein
MNTVIRKTVIVARASQGIGAALLLLGLITATPSWAAPTSCSAAIQNCISAATGKNVNAGCQRAGADCMQSGTFVGPVTGKVWNGLVKK